MMQFRECSFLYRKWWNITCKEYIFINVEGANDNKNQDDEK